MGARSRCWAGVDVGGPRKGFHLALVDGAGRIGLAGERLLTATGVLDRLRAFSPVLVAIDGPRRPAEPGERSRACERAFVAAGVCALRYTPGIAELRANPFHAWVLHGLELYRVLERGRIPAVECFPTAAWTVWGGPRRGTPRAAWSARTLAQLRVPGTPGRLGQDARDAIGAALTARLHTLGWTRVFGELVVPAPGSQRILRRSGRARFRPTAER